MANDPIAKAQSALQEAGALLEKLSRGTGDPRRLADALQRAASALDEMRGLEARMAAQQLLFDDRLLRLERNRLFTMWNTVMGSGVRAYRRAVRALSAVRPAIAEHASGGNYHVWVAHEQATLPNITAATAAIAAWKWRPTFSFIAGRHEYDALRASLDRQLYLDWELCTAAQEHTSHIAQLNAAAMSAHGEYIALLGGPGLLSPLALFYCGAAVQDSCADLLYADEDHLNEAGERIRPVFKPGWSPTLIKTCMYPGGFLLVRRTLFLQAGGLREDVGAAAVHDLVLRLAANRIRVCHIPRILFHRKASLSWKPMTVPFSSEPLAMTAVICSRSPNLLRKCIESVRRTAGNAIQRMIVVAHEENGRNAGLRSAAAASGAMVEPFTGPFNFAAMNNAGAALVETPGILFLNDDIEATRPGWAELLATQLNEPGTGIVGAVLRYPDGTLQHAGIVAGVWDGVAHTGRHTTGSPLWPWLIMTRDVSAVTGACLAIRSELFQQMGGFDAAFPNNYNDVDLCFRVRSTGLEVICVAVDGLFHAECQTRRGIVHFDERYRFYRRWADTLSRPDRYYSISLAPTEAIALNVSGDRGIRKVLSDLGPQSHSDDRDRPMDY